ncbi:MAG: diguanylate cyclase [Lachnospiraceae bacterium]|nr:diguanylate cyclase [Lachnospiraceae bacterium]
MKYKKHLNKGVIAGFTIFIVLLCLILGILNHISYRAVIYRRYQAYITDILKYNLSHIDRDDLKECTETLKESDRYLELRDFMDAQMEDFDIHYLYIVKPLNTNDTGNVMSVISAEKEYDRYYDTEGNLWLGWISDDEYDAQTAADLFDIMNGSGIVFFEERTEWGTDYTGAVPVTDSSGVPFAVLAADIDVSEIGKTIRLYTIVNLVIIIALGVLFEFLFILWSRRNVTTPIKLLEDSVEEYARRSHGQRSIDALSFEKPDIHTDNEIEALADAVVSMTDDIKTYVSEIITAEKKNLEMQAQVNEMSELANKDALTGVRNKTAYDNEVKRLESDYAKEEFAYGIAMIDLNFLKKINDNYGHDQGNYAIRKLCRLVCNTFEHSPVFRIGGDEFVVILKGRDLENVDALVKSFNYTIEQYGHNTTLEPWERVSAAIGTAFFDKNIDSGVEAVFKRADKAMYNRKKEMKAVREE